MWFQKANNNRCYGIVRSLYKRCLGRSSLPLHALLCQERSLLTTDAIVVCVSTADGESGCDVNSCSRKAQKELGGAVGQPVFTSSRAPPCSAESAKLDWNTCGPLYLINARFTLLSDFAVLGFNRVRLTSHGWDSSTVCSASQRRRHRSS